MAESSGDPTLPVPAEGKGSGASGVFPQEQMEDIRQEIQVAEQRLKEQSRAGGSGLVLAHQRAKMLSQVLVQLWKNGGGNACGDG